MAKNVFDPSKIYKTVLWGHSFTDFPGSAGNSPTLPGTFAADTVETSGGEYAIFTVSEPSGNEYPAAWAGTYCLIMDKIRANPPVYIGDVPTPSGDDPGDGET